MSGTIKNLIHNSNYKTWLADIKNRVRNAQLKASVRVNTTFLDMYWDLGADIVAKQSQSKWGEGFLLQLSRDLMEEFPDIKGFSYSNIKHIKHWYLFYRGDFPKGQQAVGPIVQQPVAQLKDRLIVQQPVGQLGQQAAAQVTPPAPEQILQVPWGRTSRDILSRVEIPCTVWQSMSTDRNGSGGESDFPVRNWEI